MGWPDRDDELLSDKGTLADLAYLLRRHRGLLRAVVGGTGSLIVVPCAVVFLHDRRLAVGAVFMAVWCFGAAWFMHHFASD